MSKRKFARFGAVITTLVAAGALISTMVASTGAYFTDSKSGAISGNLGTVGVSISGQAINFKDLLPGQVQTQTVTVYNSGTGPEDMWLAFDNTNSAWSMVNDLGQYGKFVIAGKTYDNLSNKYNSTTGVPGTPIAGSFMGNPAGSGSCGTVNRVPVNYLPSRIFLGTWAAGQTATFDVSFNFIACMSGNGPADLWSSVANDFSPVPTGAAPLGFKVAAFQPGVNPTDPFNGAGQIAPLVLPIVNPYSYPAGLYQ